MATHFTELNFALGEDIDLLRAHVQEFARREIEPLAERVDKKTPFPRRCGASWATRACSASR